MVLFITKLKHSLVILPQHSLCLNVDGAKTATTVVNHHMKDGEMSSSLEIMTRYNAFWSMTPPYGGGVFGYTQSYVILPQLFEETLSTEI